MSSTMHPESSMSAVRPDVPRVSVVMSVYNGLPLLKDAVESILAQTLHDLEFIIVNDGSTDGTLSYLQSAALADCRIRIIDQANTGLTRALVRGVEAARAPLIARMDADDISEPHRLEVQADYLDMNLGLSAVNCGITYVGKDMAEIAISDRQRPSGAIPLLMTLHNAISGHGQVVFRKSAYDRAGGYDPQFRYAQDYDLWTRMMRFGSFGEVPGLLYKFRIDHDSISTRHRGAQLAYATQIASREFANLTGSIPNQDTVSLILEISQQKCPDAAGLIKLWACNRHIERAVSGYFKKYPDRKPLLPLVRSEIGVLWRSLFNSLRHRREPRLLAIAAIAACWDVKFSVSALMRWFKKGLGGLGGYHAK